MTGEMPPDDKNAPQDGELEPQDDAPEPEEAAPDETTRPTRARPRRRR